MIPLQRNLIPKGYILINYVDKLHYAEELLKAVCSPGDYLSKRNSKLTGVTLLGRLLVKSYHLLK